MAVPHTQSRRELGSADGGYRPRPPSPLDARSNRRERSSSELSLRPPPAASSLGFASVSQAKFDELRERLAEISDLGKTAALLGWDQHVMMPPRGAGAPGRAAGDARPHRAPEVHLARGRAS